MGGHHGTKPPLLIKSIAASLNFSKVHLDVLQRHRQIILLIKLQLK